MVTIDLAKALAEATEIVARNFIATDRQFAPFSLYTPGSPTDEIPIGITAPAGFYDQTMDPYGRMRLLVEILEKKAISGKAIAGSLCYEGSLTSDESEFAKDAILVIIYEASGEISLFVSTFTFGNDQTPVFTDMTLMNSFRADKWDMPVVHAWYRGAVPLDDREII